MNVLEKILEEIDRLDDPYYVGYIERDKVEEIVRSHMDELPKCGECSRRKWYQIGYRDGKKDNDWIPVEERLPEDERNVLVVVTGRYKMARFENAIMLGDYSCIDKDWIIEGWESWKNPNVIAWRPLPSYKPAEKGVHIE